MAEPLKNSYGPEVPAGIADIIQDVYPDFDRDVFLRAALDGYDDLELTERARQISKGLAAALPGDRERAIRILIESLEAELGSIESTGPSGPGELNGPGEPSRSGGSGGSLAANPIKRSTRVRPPDEPPGSNGPSGMESFRYLPFVFFVAEEGLNCFETSMEAQYLLTQCFTAEFSIRAFLENDPERTLERLAEWALDPNMHVRRLVSEGTRPRLPWAPWLRGFQENPEPVIELLEVLKDDPEEYVRRSVANNLNDISKDHPDLVIAVAGRWWDGADANRRRLIRHGLRTLVKAGNESALAILGYSSDSPVAVRRVTCAPGAVAIGERVRIRVELENPSGVEADALVDFRVHFVKANGSTRPKVFKGAELAVKARGEAVVHKSISVAQHSTRKHYPGLHRVEVVLNGATHQTDAFEVRPPATGK